MKAADLGRNEGLALAVGVVAVAAYFAVRQWLDRRRRDPGLSPEDADHYARQDVRRWAGSVIMALLAVGLVVGTRIDIRAGRPQRQLFSAVWLAEVVLLLVLPALALADWLATRRYARRHREALADERARVLEDYRRRRREGRP